MGKGILFAAMSLYLLVSVSPAGAKMHNNQSVSIIGQKNGSLFTQKIKLTQTDAHSRKAPITLSAEDSIAVGTIVSEGGNEVFTLQTIKEKVPHEPGRGYLDFGIFAYEEGDYEEAVSHFKQALTFDAANPFYHHYLGKTYQKMERHREAMDHLSQAWEINPEIDELRYDLAIQNFFMSYYQKAIDLLNEEVKDNPSNILAHYYAGICYYKLNHYETASIFFLTAAEKSPSIKANGYYYAGICFRKMGKMDQAVKYFEYVRDFADSETLKHDAIKWLEEIKRYQIAQRPLKLYLKMGYAYDSNLRLEPLDEDIYADEDDTFLAGYFSGKYHIVHQDAFKIGIGYTHYQNLHRQLDTYDLIGSSPSVYIHYRLTPFAVGFSYLPSFYWLNGQTYMRRHGFKPEMVFEINEKLSFRMTYSYSIIDHVQDNDRDGDLIDYSIDTYYVIPDKKIVLFGGWDYEVNLLSHPDQDFGQSEVRLGLSVSLPWELNLNLSGKYNQRRYKNIDSLFSEKRRDHKYSATVSVSRQLIYPWLSLIGEYGFSRNDSNIFIYEYDKQVVTLSLSTTY